MGKIVNIEDIRVRARARLPKFIFDFVDGGAEDEVTLRANHDRFEDISFRPNVLVDVSKRSQQTTVLGQQVSLPVLIAPAGAHRLVCREGELAVARATAKVGAIFVNSIAASYTVEEVAAAAAGGPLWFQVYPWRNRQVVANMVERAKNAGYKTLCITVDVPMVGKRERDHRNQLSIPPRITWNKVLDVASRPGWLMQNPFSPPITFKNLEGIEGIAGKDAQSLWTFVDKELVNPGTNWEDLAWLRKMWKGPLVVKGILTAGDAKRAIEYGVDGIIVSNHGGRQLDGSPATIEVLPEIVDAVAGRAEVLLDGGVRRGSDVVKAIALGARACLVGRPFVFGLAGGGESGVLEMFQVFRNEIDRTLALIGRSSIAEVDRSVVFNRHGDRSR